MGQMCEGNWDLRADSFVRDILYIFHSEYGGGADCVKSQFVTVEGCALRHELEVGMRQMRQPV